MFNRKFVFIIFLSVLIAFPLSSFSSRKKVLDDDEAALQRQLELLEKREQAEAEIEARRKAAEEAELAAKLEAERREAERIEAERIAKEKADEEARIAEERRLEEEKRLEEERLLEAERLEKENQLKLQQQMELELANQKEKSSKKRKEYLSDYMVYDVEAIDENAKEDDSFYRIAQPDARDTAGRTLLMKAAKKGNEQEIKQLLYSGADVNLYDVDGWTALMYAVRYSESFNCVDLLLEAGADISMKNKYGSSALVLASCYNDNSKILKTLLEKYKSTDKEVLRSLVLLLNEQNISEKNQLDKLELFMDKALPLNVLYEGKTPLMYAAQYANYTQVIQLLLDNQASVTIRSTEGKTAFEYAMKNKNLAHDETYWALNKR